MKQVKVTFNAKVSMNQLWKWF